MPVLMLSQEHQYLVFDAAGCIGCQFDVFLRAESFYNVASNIDDLDDEYIIKVFRLLKKDKATDVFTELDSDKLCEKYGLKLIDNKGIEISEQRLNELSDLFMGIY